MRCPSREKEILLARQKGTRTRYPGVREIQAPTRATSARPATLGIYRIRIVENDPKTGRRRERDRQVEAASARDASRIRAEFAEAGPPIRVERLTLRTYATSWLQRKLLTIRKSTATTYASSLECGILPTLGPVFVDALTRDDITAWLTAQRADPHLSAHTINGRLRLLKTIVREAVDELALPRDPTARVSALPTDTPDLDSDEDAGSGKHLDADELRRLLDAAARVVPTWYPLFLTCALVGGRWGELSALRWDDLDLEKGELRIRRAHVRGVVGAPKTKASRRRVGIPDELVEVLRHHRREQLAGRRRQSAEGWMFPSRVGGLMQPSSARKPLAKAATAAGLEVRPSSHWFRHTLNRLLRQVEAGVVQRAITGHVTDAMAEHYDHVTLAEKKAAVGRVVALVRPDVGAAVGATVGPAVGSATRSTGGIVSTDSPVSRDERVGSADATHAVVGTPSPSASSRVGPAVGPGPQKH